MQSSLILCLASALSLIIRSSSWLLACRGKAVLIIISWALLSGYLFAYVSLWQSASRALTSITGLTNKLQVFVKPSNFLCHRNGMFVCLNGCVKALKWRRIVVASSVHERGKVWTLRLLTDCYLCDSLYCLARVYQNLPAPPKHYGYFDVFSDF